MHRKQNVNFSIEAQFVVRVPLKEVLNRFSGGWKLCRWFCQAQIQDPQPRWISHQYFTLKKPLWKQYWQQRKFCLKRVVSEGWAICQLSLFNIFECPIFDLKQTLNAEVLEFILKKRIFKWSSFIFCYFIHSSASLCPLQGKGHKGQSYAAAEQ